MLKILNILLFQIGQYISIIDADSLINSPDKSIADLGVTLSKFPSLSNTRGALPKIKIK